MGYIQNQSSLSKKQWYSYLVVLFIAVGGIQWLNSSGMYTFQADFEVISLETKIETSLPPQLTDPNINPFKLQTTYIHIALQRVAARLALHDLTSSEPFREFSKTYSDKLKAEAKVDISSFLDSPDKSPLGTSKYAYPVMDDLGYEPKKLKDKLFVKWQAESNKITVSFTSENPFLSAFVVNDLNRELSQLDRQMRQTYTESCIKTFDLGINEMRKRWQKDLDTNDLTHEVEGKRYWLSGHFPRSRFWLKHKESVSSKRLIQVKKLELYQEALMRDRLDILEKGSQWVEIFKSKSSNYSEAEYRALEVAINIQKRRLTKINKEIARKDVRLQEIYDALPEKTKNENWILINEDASTIYVTENYFQELKKMNRTLYEVNKLPARFTMDPFSNTIRKTPDLLIYFWLSLITVFSLMGIEVVFDKFGLNERS